MSNTIGMNQAQINSLTEALEKAQTENERLSTEGTNLRSELEEMKFKAAQEATGAELPEEEAATVAAAIGDVFADGFGEPEATDETDKPKSPAEIAALQEANLMAIMASKSGKSPTDVIEQANEAHERMKRAYEASDSVKEELLASKQPHEVANAAHAAMLVALKDGATMSSAEAAKAAAVAAVRAGARPSEAAVAAAAAAEVFDDLGEKRAAMAGLSAFTAVRNGYALPHAMNAAEAVARTKGGQPTDEKIKAETARAVELAAKGASWTAIIDELKGSEAPMGVKPKPHALPTTEALKAAAKAISQCVAEARKAGFSVDGIAAAEKAAEHVMRHFGTAATASVASLAAGGSVHASGCDATSAAVGGLASACTFVELMITRGETMPDDQIAPAPVRAAVSPLHLIDPSVLSAIDMGTVEKAAIAAGEAAAVAFMDGALSYEAYRAGAAAAAEVLKETDTDSAVIAVAARSARKEAHKTGAPEASAYAGAAAASVCRGGGSALAAEAAAAAAAKACNSTDVGDNVADAVRIAAESAAENAEAVITAAKRASEKSGKSPEEALQAAQLALSCGASAVEAAAMSIGKGLDDSSTALLACQMAAQGGAIDMDDMDAMIEGLVAAAIVAAESTGSGATPAMAIKAGQSAAVGVSNGQTLEEVQSAAKEAIPEIPGWSLESWLSSMKFDRLVSEAILKRVRAAVPKGQSIRAYEQAFVCKLGENGSVATILALLKETPVLQYIAEAICGQAQSLVTELENARVEAERAREREERREREQAERKARMMEAEKQSKSAKRRWIRVGSQRGNLTAAQGESITDVINAKQVQEEKMTAAQMNEAAKKKGAFTLAFSTDASLYWDGLARITGPPVDQMKSSIADAMLHEHTTSVDSDEFFEVGNYGTVTCSSIEWYFVTDPENGLDILGLEEWPGSEPERDIRSIRYARSKAEFRADWESVDRRLVAVGEQPLSDPEFNALRLYTGPIFRKYNAVLRKASGVKFLENQFVELCQDNHYPTTLHVLTAAILKLGKITQADLVFRAPGGALPNSFWHKQMPECVQGGIELAFMSTTTAKEEAMAYARRAPGMILFEVVQGFVARGASISWLSQYPNEVCAVSSLTPAFSSPCHILLTTLRRAVLVHGRRRSFSHR